VGFLRTWTSFTRDARCCLTFNSTSSISAPVNLSLSLSPSHSKPIHFSPTFWITFKHFLVYPCLIHSNEFSHHILISVTRSKFLCHSLSSWSVLILLACCSLTDPYTSLKIFLATYLIFSVMDFFFFFLNSLSMEWSPAGSTRHGGHWLAYCSLPRVIMMMDNLVEWRLAGETEVLGEHPS
jgi:hypothetical protein